MEYLGVRCGINLRKGGEEDEGDVRVDQEREVLPARVPGLRVEGSGFRVQGSAFGVQHLGWRVEG